MGKFFNITISIIALFFLNYKASSQTTETDLPLKGQSLFDEVFSDQNGNYQIPYPIGKLLRELNGYSSKNSAATTNLPFSRSLQKPLDLSFSPFLYPRVLLGTKIFEKRLSSSYMGNRMYIGYLEPMDQLEVISYNELAARFEFQIVKDYKKNHRPKVFYVKRKVCTSCHQGGRPIFSKQLWADTTFTTRKKQLLKEARIHAGLDPLYSDLLRRSRPELFDLRIKSSNALLNAQKIWQSFTQSKESRAKLLLSNLKQQIFKSKDAHTNPTFIEYIDFKLPSDDFGLDQKLKETTDFSKIYLNENYILTTIKRLNSIQGDQNPLTPRKTIKTNEFNVRSLFSKHQVAYFKQAGEDCISKSLDQVLKTEPHHFSGSKALNPDLLFKKLIKSCNSDIKFKERKTTFPKKQLFLDKVFPPSKIYEINLLKKHCSECHGQGGIITHPSQFLYGEDNSVFKNIKRLRPKLLEQLRSSSMPPSKSDRVHFEESGAFTLIVNWLETL